MACDRGNHHGRIHNNVAHHSCFSRPCLIVGGGASRPVARVALSLKLHEFVVRRQYLMQLVQEDVETTSLWNWLDLLSSAFGRNYSSTSEDAQRGTMHFRAHVQVGYSTGDSPFVLSSIFWIRLEVAHCTHSISPCATKTEKIQNDG